MSQKLAEAEPVFREALEECFDICSTQGLELREALWNDEERLLQTRFAQPGIFAVQYALCRLLASWGVTPDLVLGHSVGEFAAACVSGRLTLANALALVCRRGQLMEQTRPGAMLSVSLAREELAQFVSLPEVAIAGDNGPKSLVLSGTVSSIDEWEGALKSEDVSVTRLKVAHAFHSELMDDVLDGFASEFANLELGEGTIPMASTVDGCLLAPGQRLDADYWRRNIRQTVLFRSAFAALVKEEPTHLIEIGPTPALLPLAAQMSDLPRLPTLRGPANEPKAMYQFLAQAYVAGKEIDWSEVHREQRLEPSLSFPTYPFEKNRYWVPLRSPCRNKPAPHAFLNEPEAVEGGISAKGTLSVRTSVLLDAHRIHGVPVVPGGALLEAVAHVASVERGSRLRVTRLDLVAPLKVIPQAPTEVVVALSNHENAAQVTDGNGNLFVEAELAPSKPSLIPELWKDWPESTLISHGDALRSRWQAMGLHIGPALETVRELKVHRERLQAHLECPEQLRQGASSRTQALLDGVMQAALALLPNSDRAELWLPQSFTDVDFLGDLPPRLLVQGELLHLEDDDASYRFALFRQSGKPLVVFGGVHFRRAPVKVIRSGLFGASTGIAEVTESQVALNGAEVPLSAEWCVLGDGSLAKETVAELCSTLREGHPVDQRGLVLVLADEGQKEGEKLVKWALALLHRAAREAMSLSAGGKLFVIGLGLPPAVHRAVEGYCRSLSLELAESWAGMLSLASPTLNQPEISTIASALARADGRLLRWADGALLERSARVVSLLPQGSFAISSDSACLVTGGLGGLGLALVEWLVTKGARHLVIASRRAPQEASRLRIERLRAQGIVVDVAECDVTNEPQLSALLGKYRDSLAGIYHCAGVLDDAMVQEQPWEAQWNVLKPKVDGTLLLDRLTRDLKIEQFVLFSSVAAQFGAMGQTAYAAGNGCLEGIVEERRKAGLPGVAVLWPAMVGAGMAEQNERAGLKYWESRGLVASVDSSLGFHLLELLLLGDGGRYIVGAIDTAHADAQGQAKSVSNDELVTRMRSASDAEARALLESEIARLLTASGASNLGEFKFSEASFRDQGVDSFQLIELRTRLADGGILVPTSSILSHESTSAIANKILVFARGKPAPRAPDGAKNPEANPMGEGTEPVTLSAEELAPLMSPFIAQGWSEERYVAEEVLASDAGASALVRAQDFKMPNDGVYHLPIFHALLWAEVLADRADSQRPGHGLRLQSLTMSVNEMINEPTGIRPQLRLKEARAETGGVIDGTLTIAGDSTWTGELSLVDDARQHVAFNDASKRLEGAGADSCLQHYFRRLAQEDLQVESYEFTNERLTTVAFWPHQGRTPAPFNLLRWASQMAIGHAYRRLGLARKPVNEALVGRIEFEGHATTSQKGPIPLSFTVDKSLMADHGVEYLSGTFRAADLATLRLQITIPLNDL